MAAPNPVVLLVALLLAAAAAECPRDRSRMARQVLRNDLPPLLESHGYRLPDGCVFQEARDLYLSDENSKRPTASLTRWECLRCNKAFRSEDFLDQHMSNRHADARGSVADTCLADYCDMLRCSTAHLKPDSVTEEKVRVQYQANDELCLAGGGEARRRAFCRATLLRCFPPERGPGAQAIYAELEREYCSSLTCDTATKPLSLPSPGYRAVWITITVLLVLIVGLYYLTYFVLRNDVATYEDLRARKPRESPVKKSAEEMATRVQQTLLRRKPLNTF